MPISGVNPTPRTTAVYASDPALARRPQDSLPSRWLSFGRTRLALASSYRLLLSHPATGSPDSDRHSDLGLGEPAAGDHMTVAVEPHRHPLHQPPRARVERRAPVHRDAVVPQHEIADLPPVGVHEFVACGVLV